MKSFICRIGLICLIGLIGSPGVFAQESAPGKLLVKFKNKTEIRKDSEISLSFFNYKVVLREEGVVLGGKKDTALESASNLTPNISNDSPIVSVDVKDDSKVQESINKYKNDPRVEYAEPDYIRPLSWSPNDTYFQGGLQGYQWNMERIKIKQAWDVTQGGSSQIKVAVIDSGVDTSVPEFSGTNFSFSRSIRSFDFDSTNECSSAYYTPQTISNDATDTIGHGTHVAGTIAQRTNNNSHSAGIAFNTTIIPIKIYFSCLNDGQPSALGGLASDIISGINYAVSVGAKVINMSLGGPNGSLSEHEAIISAYNSGANIVVSAGNSASRTSSPPILYPSAYPETVSVGASRWDNVRSDYSQYTPIGSRGLDLVAPGGQIGTDDQTQVLNQNNDGIPDGIVQQTINPDYPSQSTSIADLGGGALCVNSIGYYDFDKCGLYQGTSMAAPHVTGVVALMLSVNPNLTPVQIKDILKNTAQTSVIPGYNSLEYGAGLLDAYAAVSAALPLPTSTPTPTPTSPISPTILITPISLIGDLNNDNKVDMLDYNIFITKFGDVGGPADFDNNNKVDIFDYAIFVSNFGKHL